MRTWSDIEAGIAYLEQRTEEMRESGRRYYTADAAYRAVKARAILEERQKGTPATLCRDVIYARKDVADAFMAMGAELALRTGDASEAVAWVKMSAQLVAAAQKDREIELRAEAQRLDREKFEAAEKRLAQMAEVADAARGGKVDPEKVADEIDRILGRRK